MALCRCAIVIKSPLLRHERSKYFTVMVMVDVIIHSQVKNLHIILLSICTMTSRMMSL